MDKDLKDKDLKDKDLKDKDYDLDQDLKDKDYDLDQDLKDKDYDLDQDLKDKDHMDHGEDDVRTYGRRSLLTDEYTSDNDVFYLCPELYYSDGERCPLVCTGPQPLEEEPCTEKRCEWINLSGWSPCKGGKQYKTRECSCKDEEEKVYRYGDYDRELFTYSSRCDGFTRTVQTCQSEKKVLTVKDWKTASWPESDDTKSRTFSCCSDNWYQIMTKTTYDNRESLYAEFIAVRLNLMSGVSSDKVSHDLDLTENLLKECSWTPTQTKEAEDLFSKLRDFNEDKREEDKQEYKQKVVTKKEDTHDTYNLDNGKEVTASNNNGQTADSENSHSLVILIVVPTVISIAVSGLAAALIYIKNKQQPQVIKA
jgi:hypothetical protein